MRIFLKSKAFSLLYSGNLDIIALIKSEVLL